MKHLLTCLVLVVISVNGYTQDSTYGRKIINELTSKKYWGRGYTKHGMKKAAEFLAKQMKDLGVEPLNGISYFQDFTYPVNTFRGKMKLTVDNKQLAPGKDFIVAPNSLGHKSKLQFIRVDSTSFADTANRTVITLQPKLTWSVAHTVADYTHVFIDKNIVTTPPSGGKINIENKFVNEFAASNVAGLIKGTEKPDSFLVVTAHYDHLGGMGCKTYFPGANDNASGVSMVLDLAKYYSKHPPRYSIVFIFFAGEEAGLLGSKYFTEHPLVSLEHTRFLINLDLVGTGEGGITVVNATEYQQAFQLVKKINDEEHYLPKIAERGKAANSDHYWFSEKGVPAFFIYTMGGIAAYHDVFDRAATLPITAYTELERLIIQFNKRLTE